MTWHTKQSRPQRKTAGFTRPLHAGNPAEVAKIAAYVV